MKKLTKLSVLMFIAIAIGFSSCKKDDDKKDDKSDSNNNPSLQYGSFTDTRDSKTYKTIKIGTQTWMAENLAYIGSDIQHITDKDEWSWNGNHDAWCYYNNSDVIGETHGVIYQREAANIACPSGWHLPSASEWDKLSVYLRDNGFDYNGEIGSMGIAKSLATNYGWKVSTFRGDVGSTELSEYRNKTGFSALPSGYRSSGGYFEYLEEKGFWWNTSDNDDNSFGYYHYLIWDNTTISSGVFSQKYGMTVRCIKD